MEGWIVILLYVAVTGAVMYVFGIFEGKKLAKTETVRLQAELAKTENERLRAELARTKDESAWRKTEVDVILPTHKKE